nr:hypothetical protein [uncultured Celeribacter sp.]
MKLFPILALCAGAASAQDISSNGYSQHEFNVIKREIFKMIKDPQSLILTRLWVESTESHLHMICGAANAKNSFGAYAGEQAFTATYDEKLETVKYLETVSDDFTLDDLLSDCFEYGMTWQQFERIDIE